MCDSHFLDLVASQLCMLSLFILLGYQLLAIRLIRLHRASPLSFLSHHLVIVMS